MLDQEKLENQMKGGTRELRYSTFVSDWWRRRGKSRRRRITGLDSFSLPIEHEKRRKRQRKPFGDFFLHRDGTSEGVIMPSHQVSLPTREKREPEKVERPNLSSTHSCFDRCPIRYVPCGGRLKDVLSVFCIFHFLFSHNKAKIHARDNGALSTRLTFYL